MSDFGDVTGLLDYPMFVVTTATGDERSGCLVGFATQVSIDPARFLVGLSNKNHTFRVAEQASRLVVHVLDGTAHELAGLFGGQTGDEVDKFASVAWTPGPDGVPVLDDAVAWFTGTVVAKQAMGDHVAFLLEVDDADVRRKPARLLTFRDVRDLDPGHEA